MTLKFSQNILKKNTYLRHRIKFHMDFEYLHVKWKKNYRKKEKITLGCNYVISQRNRTLNVDIYFLTLPPACHKEEGVFFKSTHLHVIHIFFHYKGIKYCDINECKRNKKSQTFPGEISKV